MSQPKFRLGGTPIAQHRSTGSTVKLKTGLTVEELESKYPVPDYNPPADQDPNVLYEWWHANDTLRKACPELVESMADMDRVYKRETKRGNDLLCNKLVELADQIVEASGKYIMERSSVLAQLCYKVKTPDPTEPQPVHTTFAMSYRSIGSPALYAREYHRPALEFLTAEGVKAEIVEGAGAPTEGAITGDCRYTLMAECPPYFYDAVLTRHPSMEWITIWRRHSINFRVYWPMYDPSVLPFD